MDSDKPIRIFYSSLKTGPRFGHRHVFSLLGFLGFLNVYAMRVNLSVAIVAMVNSTSNSNGPINTSVCLLLEENGLTKLSLFYITKGFLS